MRQKTLDAIGASSSAQVKAGAQNALAHAGLFLERCAPVRMEGADVGRLDPGERDAFLDKVVGIPAPPFYATAYGRWLRALEQSRTIVCEVVAEGRLLIGHGNSSPLEVGITLHPVYGVPYLPGTALKGLLNHYMASVGPKQETPGSERWTGVGYDEKKGRPRKSPGAFHGSLFGVPKLQSAAAEDQSDGARGAVVFEDAWYVPGSVKDDRTLMRDVLTPHQCEYYSKGPMGEGVGPTDWDAPVPVSFLTIRPGTRFLLAVTPLRGGDKAVDLAIRHLLDALSRWGIGGKTRAGYGRLAITGEIGCAAAAYPGVGLATPEKESPDSTLDDLIQAVDRVLQPRDAPTAPPILQRFEVEKEALRRLAAALRPSERPAALRAIERLLHHAGLMKRCGDEIRTLRSRLAGT